MEINSRLWLVRLTVFVMLFPGPLAQAMMCAGDHPAETALSALEASVQTNADAEEEDCHGERSHHRVEGSKDADATLTAEFSGCCGADCDCALILPALAGSFSVIRAPNDSLDVVAPIDYLSISLVLNTPPPIR